MSKKARLSRDQKRKQNLAKRSQRQPESNSSAYTGNRYKSKELVRPLFEIEQAIYQAYVLSERGLADDDVEEELEGLIEDLRTRPASELVYAPHDLASPRGYVEQLVIFAFKAMLERRTLPNRDDLIGVLRTILGSLEIWRSKSVSSRGYLSYLEGFMKKLGVSVQAIDDDGEPFGEPEFNELYEIGEMWLGGSPEARHRFTALARELLEKGDYDQVINACQQLLGNLGSPARPEFAILSELSIRAQKIEQERARPGIKSFISRLTGG